MTKTELRRDLRERLRAVPEAEREQASIRIAHRFWTVPEVATARTLLLFAALPDEVCTDRIAAEARHRGIAVVYPRCLPENNRLALHRAETNELRSGVFGIREPDAACPIVEVEEIDVALVPGLGWDRAGGRLGRGKGYYDRLFTQPKWRAFRCGIFLAAQEAAFIPTDQWDAPLDAVVTEEEILSF